MAAVKTELVKYLRSLFEDAGFAGADVTLASLVVADNILAIKKKVKELENKYQVVDL